MVYVRSTRSCRKGEIRLTFSESLDELVRCPLFQAYEYVLEAFFSFSGREFRGYVTRLTKDYLQIRLSR
jgi:hypothetical protein